MDDLLILLGLALWLGLWAARQLGWCGVRRGQASAAARRNRRHSSHGSVPEGGSDGPYVDAAGRRP
ncbi:hypothetical protein [Nocardioides panzhihuensis]|uniref:Uncharacterized protein n=1 Tax=Nocardioides panzhihuensis TaxID=860243 RepID=A0A7Z0DSV5_9ACTN|nr:hypothetical protein [Nocardioides panzhihuensis]NYI81176.1 hypothetical protein [Nocardioides panzhihuensis]